MYRLHRTGLRQVDNESSWTNATTHTARPSAHGMSDPFPDQGDYMGNFRWKKFGGKILVGKKTLCPLHKKRRIRNQHIIIHMRTLGDLSLRSRAPICVRPPPLLLKERLSNDSAKDGVLGRPWTPADLNDAPAKMALQSYLSNCREGCRIEDN